MVPLAQFACEVLSKSHTTDSKLQLSSSKMPCCLIVYLQGISQILAGTGLSGRCNDMGCISPEITPWCPCSNLEHIPEERAKKCEKQPETFRESKQTHLISMTEFPLDCIEGEEIKNNNKDFLFLISTR